ncbi:MAG: hypothetical protein ACLU7D_04765 [Collinsella sp.]
MDTFPITTPRKPASTCVRRARRRITQATLKPVPERLLASPIGDATGIRLDKLLTIFNALGLALAAQGDIGEAKNERPVDAPHANPLPRSIPRRHHAQRPHHRNRRSTAIPALADAPFTSALYDEVFADFAMSNLGVSIAANASNQTKPEGK